MDENHRQKKPKPTQTPDSDSERLFQLLKVTPNKVEVHDRQIPIKETDLLQQLHTLNNKSKESSLDTIIEKPKNPRESRLLPSILKQQRKKREESLDVLKNPREKKEKQAVNTVRKGEVKTDTATERMAGNHRSKTAKNPLGFLKQEETPATGSVQKALDRLEEKEREKEDRYTVNTIENRLRVSPISQTKDSKEETRSCVEGRLHALPNEEQDAFESTAETKLKTEKSSRKYQDWLAREANATRFLKTTKKKKLKKQKNSKENRLDEKERKHAERHASVSQVIQKAQRRKQALDSGEASDVSSGQGFLNLITQELKDLGSGITSKVLKRIFAALIGLVVHLLSLLVSAILTLISIFMGVIMAVLGPLLVVIICVASIFAFLFVQETEVVDTSDPAYIDNYLSALLSECRDKVVQDYVNEQNAVRADYLAYDVCFNLRGTQKQHIHDLVTYQEGDNIMEKRFFEARKQAFVDTFEAYFGKDSEERTLFLEDLKMVYFSKMYAKDSKAVPEGDDAGEEMAPYLMIDTDTEEEILTEVFNEFCTADLDHTKHPSWLENRRPYPYQMNADKLLNEATGLYETQADTLTVHVKTMEEYFHAYPLSKEEKAHYEEFARIKEN